MELEGLTEEQFRARTAERPLPLSDETATPTETDPPSETPQSSPTRLIVSARYRRLARQLDEYFRIDREQSQRLQELCSELLGQILEK